MNRREALSTLSRGAALGALAGTAAVAVSCQPVEAPAVEADPMAEAVAAHEAYIREHDLCHGLGDEAGAQAACDRAHDLWMEIQSDTPPAITTHAGALAAVRFVASDKGWCSEDHAVLLRAALAYFDGVA